MTIFSDITSRKVIHAVEGKDMASVIPFLKKLAKKAIHLQAISMDMSNAFYSTVKQELPQ